MSEPVSRVLSWMIIYLHCALLRSFSGDTREIGGQLQPSPIRPCSRWGLPSLRLTTELVVFYTTVSAFPAISRGFLFCGTFLISSPRQLPLATTLPCGARTFLPEYSERSPSSLNNHATISVQSTSSTADAEVTSETPTP